MVTLKGNKVIVRECKSGKDQKLCNYRVNDNYKPELIKLFLNKNFQIYWSILQRLSHHKYLIILKNYHSQEFNYSGLAVCFLPFTCVWCLYYFQIVYFLEEQSWVHTRTQRKICRCKKYIPRFMFICIFSQCFLSNTQDLIFSNLSRYSRKAWTSIPCTNLSRIKNLCWMWCCL